MKNILLLHSIILLLSFSSTALYAQKLTIYSSRDIVNPERIIDGNENTYAAYKTYTGCEIILKTEDIEDVEEINLNLSSGKYFSCNVYYSTDNINYTFLLKLQDGDIGNNLITVQNDLKYIKLEGNCGGDGGHLYLQDLTITTNTKIHIAYAYDEAGNRISRTLIVQELKTKNAIDMQESNNSLDWKEFGIKLYPNPTLGELIIEFENFPEKERVKMELYDFAGKKIAKEKIYNNSFMVNIVDYPEGNYMLRIFIGNELKTYQIIKK